jgi:hypothetical protein
MAEASEAAEGAPPATSAVHSQYDACITWIQARILLKGYDSSKWTMEHDESSIDFISNPNTRRMIAAMTEDGKSLVIATNNFEALPLQDAKVSHEPFQPPALRLLDFSSLGYGH